MRSCHSQSCLPVPGAPSSRACAACLPVFNPGKLPNPNWPPWGTVAVASHPAICTHHRDALIHVCPPWGVEDLARVGVLVVAGNVVGHHDHDVVILDASMVQHLVGLQWKNASRSTCVAGKLILWQSGTCQAFTQTMPAVPLASPLQPCHIRSPQACNEGLGESNAWPFQLG